MATLPCGHEAEHFSVATYGGYEDFPMRCLECMEEWRRAGRCVECGAEGKPRPKLAGEFSGDGGGWRCEWPPPAYCAACYCLMVLPERCEVCKRFAGSTGEYHEVGETPGYYDPYWGPQPPEPIGAFLCPDPRCLERLKASVPAKVRAGEAFAAMASAEYVRALQAEARI